MAPYALQQLIDSVCMIASAGPCWERLIEVPVKRVSSYLSLSSAEADVNGSRSFGGWG